MLSENKAEVNDPALSARSRIQIGPKPEWVEECSFDSEFKGENEWHITKLLLDRQIHAQRDEDYIHEAMRLETMEAVQHLSQWRLQFEPQVQSVVLHFIRLRRGPEIVEQLNLDKGHLFQREEGLNRFVIDGWVTYLQVLEDVRPGDILEWAYTIHTTRRILPEFYTHFQYLPEWTSIGKYRFVVRCETERELKWKTPLTWLNPSWRTADGLSIRTWCVDNYQGLKREPNTPSWYVSAPWIQISDCLEWQTIARAVAEAWARQESSPAALDELAMEIEKEKTTLPERIDKAIQLIQDEHRYLSVNLEFGGQTPSAPSIVAHRRYGDCKDLSFLLVNLLQRLGVQSRPVLVNTQLRKSIGKVLPTPNVFNHVVVEFEAEGKKRWVDPTIKRQGGGAYNRYVFDYGLGLPVDPSATGLIEQPKIPGQSNLYELKETILLDTRGAPSLVSLVSSAEGVQADKLRNEFAAHGIEAMTKSYLQACANRFGRAKRVGELKFRDDRAANQFCMAEVFEIDRFLMAHSDNQHCRFAFPSQWIKNTLPLPEKKNRKTPFALPYPCQLIHNIEIATSTAKPTSSQNIEPRCSLQSSYVQFHRTKKAGYGYLIMNLAVTVTADSVPPDQIEKHRNLVGAIWNASLWNYISPVGYAKPRQSRGFGELPPPKTMGGSASAASRAKPVVAENKNIQSPASTVSGQPKPLNSGRSEQTLPETKPAAQFASQPRKRRHNHSHGVKTNRSQITLIIVGGIIFLLFILLLIAISSGGRIRH